MVMAWETRQRIEITIATEILLNLCQILYPQLPIMRQKTKFRKLQQSETLLMSAFALGV